MRWRLFVYVPLWSCFGSLSVCPFHEDSQHQDSQDQDSQVQDSQYQDSQDQDGQDQDQDNQDQVFLRFC